MRLLGYGKQDPGMGNWMFMKGTKDEKGELDLELGFGKCGEACKLARRVEGTMTCNFVLTTVLGICSRGMGPQPNKALSP